MMEPFADREIAALERRVHRALRALPAVRAPQSLAPRVLQAVRAAQSGWRGWRLEWQLLSLIGACSLIIAVALAVPRAQTWIAGLTTTRAVASLWQTFLAPIAMPVVIFTFVMCTACALIVAALKHVAWEGREISH